MVSLLSRIGKDDRLLVFAVPLLFAGWACLLPSLAFLAPPTATFLPVTPTETIHSSPYAPYSVQADGNSLGDPAAPVPMDVWEDFQRPACAYSPLEIGPQIIRTYVETGRAFYT